MPKPPWECWINQRCLGTPHRVRAVVGRIKPEFLNPVLEDPSVLPRSQMR